jgi:type II secretory ATPase GspE/PulE/Tfp pilus assembly ATPase PilB-like protein
MVSISNEGEMRRHLRNKYMDFTLAGLGMMHEEDVVHVIVQATTHRAGLLNAVYMALTDEYVKMAREKGELPTQP